MELEGFRQGTIPKRIVYRETNTVLPYCRSAEEFSTKLNENVSASAPIKSIEHLRGREEQSKLIGRALQSPGRSAFIYGDRGVGKTSLAQTSAYTFNSSSSNPIFISIDSSTTFFKVIHDIANEVAGLRPDFITAYTKRKGSISGKGLSAEVAREIQSGRIPEPASINEAVSLIEFFFPSDTDNSVVVIDEFERLSEDSDRGLFADFIKQIGDRSLNLRFIFCGVALSLEQLLEDHHSCYRYLEAIELERLGWEARAEIIDSVASAFGVSIDIRTRWRIAAISDGYPYYIHIVCEKLFWEFYEDESLVASCEERHFEAAIRNAIIGIQPQLRRPYNEAVRKYSSGYEEVLWAAADHTNLERRSTEIFESYCRIAESVPDRTTLTRSQFNQRLNSLKKPSHASVLIGTRQGWYRFAENVLRGYVRLQAQQSGVDLDVTPH